MKISNKMRIKISAAIIGILGALLIATSSPPAGLTTLGMQVLATLFLMVVFLAFQPIPIPATALLTLWIFWEVLNMAPAVVFAGWTNSTLWFIFAALLISLAMEKSGLAKRLGYLIVSRFGVSNRKLLLGFVVASLVSLVLIPDANARPAVLLTILIGFLSLMHLTKDSAIGKRLAIAVAYLSVAEASTAVFTANALQIAAVGVLQQTQKVSISYVQWSVYEAVPALLIPLIAVFLLLPRLFRAKDEIPEPQAREVLKAESEKMGKITHREIAILLLVITAVGLWATGTVTSISAAIVAVIVGVILLTPIGGVKISDIPNGYWGIIFFNGTLFGLAPILGKTGVSHFIATKLSLFINSPNPILFSLSVGAIAIVAGATLSGLAAMGILLPSVLEIGNHLGFSPIFTTVLFVYANSVQLFFYLNSPSITVLGFGLFGLKDWYKFVAVMALIQFVMIPVYVLTIWHFVGLV